MAWARGDYAFGKGLCGCRPLRASACAAGRTRSKSDRHDRSGRCFRCRLHVWTIAWPADGGLCASRHDCGGRSDFALRRAPRAFAKIARSQSRVVRKRGYTKGTEKHEGHQDFWRAKRANKSLCSLCPLWVLRVTPSFFTPAAPRDFLFPDDVQHDFAPMRRVAVLEDIDRLPRAQDRRAVLN